MNNVDETPSWRMLLDNAIRPPGERQRIAQVMGLNPVTLTRWANGQSLPRQEKLRSLYDAVPALQERLLQEYPDLLRDEQLAAAAKDEIPAAFYDRILSGYGQLPRHLRQHALCTLLMQQVLAHLDPKELGMAVFLAQCVPPTRPQSSVRSLRMTLGRATPSWVGDMAQGTCFFGIESQTGNTLSRGYPLMTINREEREHFSLPEPPYAPLQLESVMSAPIMQAECVAGCLCAFSPRSSAFSSAQLQLFERYVHLLAVILPQEQFYPLEQIELALLPPFPQQQPILQTFQARVQKRLRQASLNGHTLSLEVAERTTWQELEQLLIHTMALTEQEQPEEDF